MAILVNDDWLWDLIESDENDQLDFKSAELLLEPDDASRYKIAKHIVGFANHRGGNIVFGVDDNGEPEGADLAEELCLSTISEIVAEKCSPSVDFSHSFYSDSKGDLSHGAILVLKISEKATPPPVAIIENSDGKIRKREYRIRSGESTRLVSDGELQALFSQKHELELNGQIETKYIFSDDLSPANVSLTPFYFIRLDDIYDIFSLEKEAIKKTVSVDSDETDGDSEEHIFHDYGGVFTRMLCIAVLSQMTKMSRDDFIEKLKSGYDGEYTQPAYNFKTIKSDEINFRDKNDKIFELSSSDPKNMLDMLNKRSVMLGDEKRGLFVPKKASVNVSENFQEITINVKNQFSLKIELNWTSTLTGYPERHPQSIENSSYRYPGRVVTRGQFEGPVEVPDVRTCASDIKFEAKFEYPRQSQGEYITSKIYCENIKESVFDFFSWQRFIDDLPNRKLFEIEKKIEEIDSKIGNFDLG